MSTAAKKRSHEILFPIVDELVEQAELSFKEDGGSITCKKGCNHCCHLLIEISWEEGVELARWLERQTLKYQQAFLGRLLDNVSQAKEFFKKRRSKEAQKFHGVVRGPVTLPDSTYDDYFYYSAPKPCPFLVDGICSAYISRPTPCRLHLVSTPAIYCSSSEPDPEEYDVPEQLEEARKDLGPIINALEKDGRWGHFGIVLWDVLCELSKEGALKPGLSKLIHRD